MLSGRNALHARQKRTPAWSGTAGSPDDDRAVLASLFCVVLLQCCVVICVVFLQFCVAFCVAFCVGSCTALAAELTLHMLNRAMSYIHGSSPKNEGPLEWAWCLGMTPDCTVY